LLSNPALYDEVPLPQTLPVILVVDDEQRSRETLQRVLSETFTVLTAANAIEAEACLLEHSVHVILCDQRMPGTDGVTFLKQVRQKWPEPVRMVISGYTEAKDIIAGVNEAGIYQYVTKPWEPEELLRSLQGAVQLYELHQDNQNASIEMKLAAETVRSVVDQKKATLKHHFDFERILHAENSPLRRICEMARKIAGYDISVLIMGESGTGKELMARALHYSSHRADKPFVVQNCGALPDELLESELFGSRRGAYTGAYENRTGLFEQANGGTIFLDEIGETSPAFQVKLLRALQDGEIRPLGAAKSQRVDVRVIAATNRELAKEVTAKRFRQDLYYRLAAFPLHLPPLRTRSMDIPLLAALCLGEAMRILAKPVEGFTDEALSCLRRYHWPGNVRELRNEIIRMVALSEEGSLGVAVLSDHIRHAAFRQGPVAEPESENGATLKERVEQLEARVIREHLIQYHGNISHVAEKLGLSRVGLRSKMHRYGLSKEDKTSIE